MKQTILAAALFGAFATTAQAVDMNTDALKRMQQEGHKIADEAKAGKLIKANNGNCLATQGKPGTNGANLVTQKCNNKAKQHRWSFDGQGRLVNDGGLCVEVAGNKAGGAAQMSNCKGNAQQKWAMDGQKRLKGRNNLCLQVNGNKVVTADCAGGGNQKWR